MYLFFVRDSQNTEVSIWTPLELIDDFVAELVFSNYFTCPNAPDNNV
jgi:hypothetical protein